MKKYLTALFIVFYFSSNLVLGQKTTGTRFEMVDLNDFIKFVSEKTNISIIYSRDSIPQNVKINMYSPSVLSDDDFIKILFTVLKENNITAISKGNTIFLTKTSNVKKIGGKYSEYLTSFKDTFLTTIIELKNIRVSKLVNTIRHIMSPFGTLDVLDSINTIIITDTKDRIKQISLLLNRLDSSDNIITKLYSVKNAASGDIVKELNKFFNELISKKNLSYIPVVISEDSTNSILIAARKKDFKFIEPVVNSIIEKTTKERFEKVFYIKNAVAKEVYEVISKLLAKSPGFKTSSVSFDEGTNSIIFIGNPITYEKVANLIEKLDVPRKQVYIESLIIETSLSKLSEFGVEWSGAANKGSIVGIAGSFNQGNLAQVETNILSNQQIPTLPGGFNLGVLGNVITYNGVKFASLGALLNALKSNGEINIISNPKIVTLDNQKATIFVGENRPYLTSQKYDSNGNPIYTYDYKDVGVKLTIMPHINGDKILIDTALEVKKVVENVVVGNTYAPVTITRSTSTKISLESGEKILISGLIENDSEKTVKGVPVLSSIPYLGNLFKYKKDSKSKTSLMIFLSVMVMEKKEDLEKIITNSTITIKKSQENSKNDITVK